MVLLVNLKLVLINACNGHHTSHAQEPADLQTSAQPAQPTDSAQDAKGPSFMTLPNGNVLEVIDVGVF